MMMELKIINFEPQKFSEIFRNWVSSWYFTFPSRCLPRMMNHDNPEIESFLFSFYAFFCREISRKCAGMRVYMLKR